MAMLWHVGGTAAHDRGLRNQLSTIIEFSVTQHYEKAESLLVELMQEDEQEPAFYFFMAAVIQSKMMDYEDNRWEAEFYRYLDISEKLARAKIDADKKDKWGYFYLGSSLSYQAFYEGKRKNYISAIKYAIKGMSALKKALDIDPQFHDVYFGLGSYKYWRSKATKYINWLPMIKDEREAGIEMVKQAALKGELTTYAAINELTWILIDDGEVSEALTWAKRGLEKFPTSRFFLWGVAKSYMNLKDFENAITYFQAILQSILDDELMNNHYNRAICYYNLAKAHHELGQHEKSIVYLDLIDSLEVTEVIAQRLTNIYRNSKSLRKSMVE